MKKILIKTLRLFGGILLLLGFIGSGHEVFANILTEGWTTFDLMPIRSINVKGDAAKFRAINWMNDGATGGIKDMLWEGDVRDGDHLTFEGHAIPGDNDIGSRLEFTRGKGGYFILDYSNFRKYYDIYGGYYSNFTTNPINKLAVDPELDIGSFFFELGSGTENDPGVSLSYAHDTREGIKSRLTWGDVTEGVTRKINPAWQNVSTATDIITLKGNVDIAGFNVQGKQHAEFYGGRNLREDNDTTEFIRTSEEPQTKQLITSLKGDRWIIDDKTYVSFGYQYQHLTNDIVQTILAFDTANAPTSSSHNRVVDAQASRDSHSWIQHFATSLTPNLNVTAKLKQEIVAQTGTGFAEGFLGGSNRAIETENQINRAGESISLRYSGISKTTLYTDWDFQQTSNWFSKDRIGSSHTEYLDSNPEMTGVMGFRYAPNSRYSLTSNLRLKYDNNTYNIFTNNDTGVTISRLQTESNEWSNKFTWKPARWVENSFRVQLLKTVYNVQSTPQYVTSTDWIKSNMDSRVYSYDLVLMPWDQWMFNVGGSLNQSKVSTPASQKAVASGGIPVFVADVYTLLFSSSYAPKENLSFYTSAQYSRAGDFDSQAFKGMPYGINNELYDVNLGMRWSPKKDITLEPRYGYYAYRANPNGDYSLDYGNYSAHVYWLDMSLKW